ncbi:hypothetical protein ASE04_01790 [Rhizobium sp. Root708]|uniref:hypothetical protein n=1 Tax=Rhizobium sp. Root708 TaxID=1736592 RepID=UPI0006F7368D|nr:hypothetical protein [Rhizobium sp. Root708]KRB62932.1 hypothetical protein ASE04_01790 [Rhizobium sp. Root708]
MRDSLARVANSAVTHTAFAFFAMGSWALFANRAHPFPKAVTAAVIQGIISACLTLFLKTVVERLSRSFQGQTALWAPPLLACLGSSAILATIHLLSGTPEVLKTIAVPLLVSTSYATIYNYALYRKRGLA